MKNFIKIISLALILILIGNENLVSKALETKNIDVVVIIKNNGVFAVNVNNPLENIMLKEGEGYRYPLISQEGYVVFRNEKKELYISKIDFNNKNSSFKVDDNVSSYVWNKDGDLIYSKTTGGFYKVNPKSQSISLFKEGKEYYTEMVLGKDSIFGVKNLIKEDASEYYPTSLGVFEINLSNKNEEVIVPYIPVNPRNEDLGLDPGIAAISKNGTKLFVWLKPNSASITADGVDIGVYDAANKKFKEIRNKDIKILTYKDNIAVSPIDSNIAALINGNDRFMNINKTLGIFNVKDESFKNITNNNEVAMTPSFSVDGKKIIYAASQAMEDFNKWQKSNNQNIYEVSLEDNKITQLTNSRNDFDFSPKYVNDKEFIFIRKDKNNTFSLVKGAIGGKEQVIVNNIVSPKDVALEQDFYYYGHYNIDKIMDYRKIN